MSPSTGRAQLEEKIREHQAHQAIVLGSGMSSIADLASELWSIPFSELFDGRQQSVQGHRGQVSIRNWNGSPLVICEGRLHFYEGHPWDRVTRVVQLLGLSGVQNLLLTNAAGSLREDFAPGSIMLIEDHLEMNHPRWWLTSGLSAFGPSSPTPYSDRLRELMRLAAAQELIDLKSGTYGSVTGPCYETPAEVKAFRNWGASAVGMSTTREVLAAREVGMEVTALSLLTNYGAGISGSTLNHEEVLAMAERQKESLGKLLSGYVQRVDEKV